MKTQVDKQIDDLRKKAAGGTGGGHETYTAVTAPLQFNNGDIWYQIDNTTSKNATAMYKAVNSAWELQCNFGGGSGTVVNVSHAILVDRSGS